MDTAGIYAHESDRLGRYVQFGYASERLLSVSFPETPDGDASDEHPLLDRIGRYLEGEPDDFEDVAVALTLPTDQRSVLESLRGVGYGENTNVAALARLTPDLNDDDDDDLRAVREALAANPAPLVVGDHRVRDGPSAAPPEVVQQLRALEGL
ncbi:methylated-DNA--[protein]-cysteine S-methyltransferase [Halosegnis rubeus]|jgi:methylated-DNA-[protein]-cysteine S-methyltransferase|uniref:Methylated-DNA--[protein]-cysteine S-methyltransferase n=1 Tax=Halosegnis rubeus TaxID=2212850 RepID=A0A5N5U844_9EURY|nr:MGMT family protein [Halosegnis rubeus]KAB7514820.1 methylated-DNA--[protein]-cysteine S-methyltransferase [Halosegnis rubeus]KAB7518132.1 methylated-DNA--[protein]-cysteine S-methyltransferase [Halosegnis rubeus]KAB7519294.1 methylated-DNA--[protein]-cysteine S-methyltransferase [Halosegnis rubeus]